MPRIRSGHLTRCQNMVFPQVSHLFTACHPHPMVAVSQSLGHVRLFETPWTAAHKASLSFTITLSLLKLMSFESVMPSNHLILHHLLLPTMVVVGISQEYPRQGKVRLEIRSHVPSDGHFSFLQRHKEEVELISFYHAVSFRQ